MIVVSDASPLITLEGVGRLDLLAAVFGRVVVPSVVQQEVDRGLREGAGLAAIPWIDVLDAGDPGLVAALSEERLDPGEAAALALALELHADWLLVDERLARRVAMERGQRVVGLLGVLLAAKRRGILVAIRPLLEDMRDLAGFRVSARLVREVLEAAGESA